MLHPAPARRDRARGRSPRRDRGFSSSDLLVTLAIAAAVFVAAAPSALESIRTYQRNAAARHVLAAVREVQDLAVSRRGIHALHWGADPLVGYSPGAYRIVRDTTGSCGIPATTAGQDGVDVVDGWADLSTTYPGTVIESIEGADGTALAGIMFDSRGAAVNTCASATFPVEITVADSGGRTRVIEIARAGSTTLR